MFKPHKKLIGFWPHFRIKCEFFSCALVMVIFSYVFPSECLSQSSTTNSDQPPLRTNAQDVQLNTPVAITNAMSSNNGSSQDQWKSLTTSPSPNNDPMVTPASPKLGTTTNSPSALLAESNPKSSYSKDAYGPQTGWGLRTAMGAALQQSTSSGIMFNQQHLYLNFAPGFRWDFETFYNITNGFSFGVESGFIYNSISSFLRSYGGGETDGRVSGDFQTGNGAYYQVPVLFNIRFQVPNSGRFRSYFTGGAGGVWDYLGAAYTDYTGSQNQTIEIQNSISRHQWNYAFQLGAGFQYNLLPGLDLDTSFKTFITPNPLIFSDGTSQVKASYNYALEIGLAYRF